MALSTLKLSGPIVNLQWAATNSGNSTSNQFLTRGSQVALTTTETGGQLPAPQALKLWRLTGGFMTAAAQQAVLTARVNGVSQSLTATIGTGTTPVVSDLASSIVIGWNDLLSVMFHTTVADNTANTAPRAWLIGASDNSLPSATAFVPSSLAGLVLDLNADSGVSGSAGTFAWLDQSGAGNNASAVTGSLGLTSSSLDAAFNGHGSVTCNGTNDAIKADGIGALISGNPGTVFYLVAVHRYVTLQAGQVSRFVWSNSTAPTSKAFQINKNTSGAGHVSLLVRTNDAVVQTLAVTGTDVMSTTAAHLWDYAADGTNVSAKMDGSSIISSTAIGTGQITTNQFTIGARRLNNVPGLFSNIALTRLLVYSQVPGTSDQATLRAYLKNLYRTP